MATDIGATEVSLEWTKHRSPSNNPSSFRFNCVQVSPAASVSNTSHIITLSEEQADYTNVINFTYLVTGLEEYTNYTCSIIARNVFGDGSSSNHVTFRTLSDGTYAVAKCYMQVTTRMITLAAWV